MTKEEKCLLAIDKGYTYNPETGKIYGIRGKEIKGNKGNNNGYLCLQLTFNKNKYNLLAHQFAWYWVYKECVEEIDHINRIKFDNRIYNLRSVTRSQNLYNRNSKGYYFNKNCKKFESQIKINNKHIYLGLFNTEEEAKNAYLQAKEKYHII